MSERNTLRRYKNAMLILTDSSNYTGRAFIGVIIAGSLFYGLNLF